MVWSEIYFPAEIRCLNDLFDQAEELAAKEKILIARLRFVRKEFMGPFMTAAEKFNRINNALRGWRFAIPEFGDRQVMQRRLSPPPLSEGRENEARCHRTVMASPVMMRTTPVILGAEQRSLRMKIPPRRPKIRPS